MTKQLFFVAGFTANMRNKQLKSGISEQAFNAHVAAISLVGLFFIHQFIAFFFQIHFKSRLSVNSLPAVKAHTASLLYSTTAEEAELLGDEGELQKKSPTTYVGFIAQWCVAPFPSTPPLPESCQNQETSGCLLSEHHIAAGKAQAVELGLSL